MMNARSTTCHRNARSHGFTLVELVVGMVISAILMGMIAMIMGSPVERYLEQSKRNDLVNASERITRMVGEDLKTALPNSVRVENYANTSVLQMLAVSDVVFYRESVIPPNPSQELSFTTTGDTFAVNGAPFSQTRMWLVVNHQGLLGHDAYALTNVITRSDVPTSAVGGVATFTLDDATFAFADGSPSNRMFGVSGPVTYVCNRTTGILRRFRMHAIDQSVPMDESADQLNSAGTDSTVVATGVFGCNLACSFMPNTTNVCKSIVTFDVTMTRGEAPEDENLHLLQQFVVENMP